MGQDKYFYQDCTQRWKKCNTIQEAKNCFLLNSAEILKLPGAKMPLDAITQKYFRKEGQTFFETYLMLIFEAWELFHYNSNLYPRP